MHHWAQKCQYRLNDARSVISLCYELGLPGTGYQVGIVILPDVSTYNTSDTAGDEDVYTTSDTAESKHVYADRGMLLCTGVDALKQPAFTYPILLIRGKPTIRQ